MQWTKGVSRIPKMPPTHFFRKSAGPGFDVLVLIWGRFQALLLFLWKNSFNDILNFLFQIYNGSSGDSGLSLVDQDSENSGGKQVRITVFSADLFRQFLTTFIVVTLTASTKFSSQNIGHLDETDKITDALIRAETAWPDSTILEAIATTTASRWRHPEEAVRPVVTPATMVWAAVGQTALPAGVSRCHPLRAVPIRCGHPLIFCVWLQIFVLKKLLEKTFCWPGFYWILKIITA